MENEKTIMRVEVEKTGEGEGFGVMLNICGGVSSTEIIAALASQLEAMVDMFVNKCGATVREAHGLITTAYLYVAEKYMKEQNNGTGTDSKAN